MLKHYFCINFIINEKLIVYYYSTLRSIICSTLLENNYEKKIKFYETNK